MNSSTDKPIKKQIKVTIIGRLMGVFPATHMLLFTASIFWFACDPGWYHPIFVFASIYLYPLLTFRIHDMFFPLVDSRAIIPSGKYPPWWGSFHIQRAFLTFPFLEGFLRMFPGIFQTWLRLWGSKIGKNVIFPPLIEIADRSLLEIGDFSVLGQHSGYYSHVLNPSKDGRILLFVKKIKIGSGCFVGSGSRLGPGTEIPSGTKLDVLTDLYVNQKVSTDGDAATNS